MNRLRSIIAFLGLAACTAGALCNAAETGPGPGAAGPAIVPVPPIPPLFSPVQFFRELLKKSQSERDQDLATRSPESRKVILAKLQEYQVLPEAERELRLRTTELSWYLRRLLPLTPDTRATLLTNVPEAERELLKVRLAYWDGLPTDQQKTMLENETILPYLAQIESGQAAELASYLRGLSEERRLKVVDDLNRLRRLSAGERERVLDQFNRIFELSGEEKARALASLPELGREQLEQAFRVVAQLPEEKRPAYEAAVRKFAVMSAGERAQFLKNAERWKQMSNEERTAWRALTSQLPPLPPMPPGFRLIQPPPLPPDPRAAALRVPLATTN